MSDQIPGKAAHSQLGHAIASARAGMTENGGIIPLEKSSEAFASRYHLILLAEKTLDIQYYIWELDTSGTALFGALQDAADRGVRVRLLLDDNNTQGLDDMLSLLDSHPNIEVRLFNPFSFRTLRILGYITDFARLNRRMHNKSFTVDGLATIIGGRNIGDAYFGLGSEPLFTDLDVLAVGPVVSEVTADFERYWKSRPVAPLRHVLDTGTTDEESTRAAWREHRAALTQTPAHISDLANASVIHRLEDGTRSFIWAKTHLLSDDPRKGRGWVRPGALLAQRLMKVMGSPENHIDIVSAYFVPGRAGVAQILQLVRKGVKVAILTNSLAANDVTVVHAGYARWRKKLLRYGVALYELKPHRSRGPALHDRGLTGNSGASLHAKTFSIDGKTIFIGSFNFDPRSAMLNTEMGLVIESPPLATHLHQRFLHSQHDAAWQLRLGRRGRLEWIDNEQGRTVILRKEPGATFWRRWLVKLVYWLPVEWLL